MSAMPPQVVISLSVNRRSKSIKRFALKSRCTARAGFSLLSIGGTIRLTQAKGSLMKLLRLPRSKVQLGTPLPWNVRDEQCNLLLTRGHVVDSEHLLEQLLARGAFVDAEEVKAAKLHECPAVKAAVVGPSSLIDLWGKSADAMRKLMIKPLHNPELLQHEWLRM